MRKRGRKPYSISYLLSKQPKGLTKDPYYPLMMRHYYSSDKLKRVRFSRRCYSLLQHAKIRPENLRYFYRTYRLPRDPFFPLFFAVKRRYIEERERKKEERSRYIAARMRALPSPVIEFVKLLALVEQNSYHRRGRFPVWERELFPQTKKRVHEYERFDYAQWIHFFRDYLGKLDRKYGRKEQIFSEKLLALFVLDIIPEGVPIRFPKEDTVKREYRRLSKLHHPDRGGKAEYFVELKRARDLLLS